MRFGLGALMLVTVLAAGAVATVARVWTDWRAEPRPAYSTPNGLQPFSELPPPLDMAPSPDGVGRAGVDAQDPARLARVRQVRPATPPPLTLAVADADLSDVAPRVLSHFGLRSPAFDRVVQRKNRRVSLSLESADGWKALEAVCSLVDVDWSDFNRAGVLGCGGIRTVEYVRREKAVDVGGVRLLAELSACWDGKNPSWLWLEVYTPPGHIPSHARVEGLSIVNDRGGRIALGDERHGEPYGVTLSPGQIGHYHARGGTADATTLGSSLTIKGTLVVYYPRDVDIVALDFDRDEIPREVRMGVWTLSLVWESMREDIERRDLTFRWIAAAGTEPALFQLAHYRGDKFMSFDGFYSDRARERHQVWSIGEKPPKGTRLHILRYVGEDPLRIPFAIEKLPVGKP